MKIGPACESLKAAQAGEGLYKNAQHHGMISWAGMAKRCFFEGTVRTAVVDKESVFIMNIVIVNCFDTWEHRVDLLYKVLEKAGHKVRVLQSDYRHIDKIRRSGCRPDYRFFMARPYRKNISFSRLCSHAGLSKDIFAFVEEHEAAIDLLWVLAPPNSFVKEAGDIKRRHGHICLIIDLIDLWPETMPVGIIKHLPVFKLWKKLRDDNLRQADMVTVECNLYKRVLAKTARDLHIETLYLAREDQGYEPHLNLPEKKTSLCYLGSINNIIDIHIIRKIIRQFAKQQPVILHIIGDGEKKDELAGAAEAAGAQVVCHGKVYDRNKKQQIFDSCHYGLNIMKKSVCVGLTMKSMDYFEFGLPVINNIQGDTWDAVEEYGVGINWNGKCIPDIDINRARKKSRNFFEKYLSEKAFTDVLFHQILRRNHEKDKDNSSQFCSRT